MLKMIPVKLMMLGCALILVPAANASAHSNEARQDEQADAIEQGRREGSITWREGRQLRKDQREIARVKETLEAGSQWSPFG